MKSRHIIGLLLVLGVCYISDVLYKMSGHQSYSHYLNGLWSIVIKPVMLALSVSCLSWNLVFWDSIKPGLDPKPVRPMDIFKRQDLPPCHASLNYYVALSLGPLIALAYFW
ncbi:hypothetical protein WDU94_014331 [Cyamophila willieti]